MKKISLFLLAANLIVSLWLYTNFNQSQTTVAKKEQSNGNADVILTLKEVGVEPVQDSTEVMAAIDVASTTKPVDLDIEVAEGDDASSSLFSLDQGVQKNVKNLQKNVETRVKEAIGFVGDVIDDIEAPVAPTLQCYTLGPFLSAQDADNAARRLQEKNIELVVSETERHDPGGYWVYVPSDSLRSARKQIDELKRRGVEDVAISTEAGVRHWVSLGVYSTKERAQRRQAALSNLGFYTRMEGRVVKTPEHWIDITLTPEQDPGMIDRAKSADWPSLKQTFCREAGNS